jgi:hypothetical protein
MAIASACGFWRCPRQTWPSLKAASDDEPQANRTSPQSAARALPALRRARQHAEEIAIASNTALITVVDGEIVRVQPKHGGDGERENGSDNRSA